MVDEIVVKKARLSDLPQIYTLVQNNNLPTDGLAQSLNNMFVAIENRQVIGTAALEVYSPLALLRSVTVSPFHQGKGIGEKLVKRTLELALDMGVDIVYILTITNPDYFERFGFKIINKKDVPKVLTKSIEYCTFHGIDIQVLRLESKNICLI